MFSEGGICLKTMEDNRRNKSSAYDLFLWMESSWIENRINDAYSAESAAIIAPVSTVSPGRKVVCENCEQEHQKKKGTNKRRRVVSSTVEGMPAS